MSHWKLCITARNSLNLLERIFHASIYFALMQRHMKVKCSSAKLTQQESLACFFNVNKQTIPHLYVFPQKELFSSKFPTEFCIWVPTIVSSQQLSFIIWLSQNHDLHKITPFWTVGTIVPPNSQPEFLALSYGKMIQCYHFIFAQLQLDIVNTCHIEIIWIWKAFL